MGKSGTDRGSPSRPLGVFLIALVQILHGLWYLLITLVLFAYSSSASDEGKGGMAGISFILALAYFLLGVLYLWLARGIVKGQEWARRRGINAAEFAIVLILIGGLVFQSRVLVPESPFWTIIGNALIIWYLRRDKVRRFFAARSATGRR